RQRVFEHYLSIPSAIRHGLIEPILKLLPDSIPMTGKVKSYVTQANTPLPDRLQSYNFLHRHSAEEVFSSDFLAEVSLNAPLDLQRSVYNAPDEAISLNRMLYLDWQFTLADNDLRKVNQMCSIAGVEVTYPLLDDQLVAFSCEIPSAWKIKDGDLRHFFKEALKDWLPAETISKRKQGFGLPFGVWMKTYKPLQEMAYDNLLNLKGRNLINPDFIDRTIELHRSGHAPYYGELVWILTVFEMWMQCHSVRDTQK
ncbi:MAG: asparagine synthase, partial [Gammaproteobacteria bacterium]